MFMVHLGKGVGMRMWRERTGMSCDLGAPTFEVVASDREQVQGDLKIVKQAIRSWLRGR